MAKFALEGLRVYRMAEDLADICWEMSAPWDLFARDTVGKQLVRAADSVGANIAEAMDGRRLSPKQSAKRIKATRPVGFNGHKYIYPETLANDLYDNPADVVQRDPGVQQPFDHLQHDDVVE